MFYIYIPFVTFAYNLCIVLLSNSVHVHVYEFKPGNVSGNIGYIMYILPQQSVLLGDVC